MHTLLDLNVNCSQQAELDRKTPSDVSTSVAETSLRALSEGENRHLPFAISFPFVNDLDDRLALESELFQFVLSESEAAFTSPIHLFFNPGGQKLQYNQN